MSCHPAHRISAVLSHRIQSPHHSGLLFSEYSPVPATHTKTDLPSLPVISHNTVRLRNAYDFHPAISCRSVYITKYRVVSHLPHKCNAHHSSPQAQCQALLTSVTISGLQFPAPESHDPVIPKRSYPCQISPDTLMPLFLHCHIVLLKYNAELPPPDMHSMQ